MNDEIFFDGVRHISASDAASTSGFTRDYIGRLCRDGKVRGRRIGKNWYIDNDSFKAFLVTQEYAKSLRSETLAKERAEEYKIASTSLVRKDVAISAPKKEFARAAYAASALVPVSSALTPRGNDIREKLQKALETPASPVLKVYEPLAHMPGGFASAALQAVHIPTYTLTPFAEFVHKLVALTLTLALVFGTYAAVDPQYATFAAESVQGEVAAAVDSYKHATGGGIGELADRTQSHVAAVAENPQLAASAVAGTLTDTLPNLAAHFAQALNTSVNNFVYAIAFPASLVRSIGVAGGSANGSVAIEVLPYQQPLAQNTTASAAPAHSSGSTTIINQPVVERILTTERVVSAGGISEAQLDAKLNQLNNKLTAQIYAITSQPNTLPATGGYTNNIALTQRIDNLNGTHITNATISGGTISGVSLGASDLSGTVGISNGGTGTSTAPSYGQVLLGNSSGTYDLVATSSLGIVGGSGGGGSDPFTHPSATISATTTLLQFFGGASTTLLSANTAYFGGTATSTFSSNGSLNVASAFTAYASSTIGGGTQTTGLTISGGATTTGDALFSGTKLTLSNSASPTTGSLYFGNGTANLNYNSSDFTLTGGNLFTAAGRITAVGLNETVGVGVRYVSGDGTYYVGASHSASPDLIFTNNAFLERARLTDAGNFGIGTTTPGARLSVEGSSLLGNSATAGYFTATTTFASVLPYASSTALTATNLFSTNFLTLGSTTLQNFTALNATTSNATTTTFAIGSLSGPLQALSGVVSATSTLSNVYGGTGFSTYTPGDILYANAAGNLAKLGIGGSGTVLKVSGGLPAWGTDLTGGGGGGSGFFATTSDSLAIHPTDTSYVTLLGTTATSTTGNILEVLGNSLFRGNLSITGTLALNQASTTLFSNTGTAYFGGTATSTFNSAGVLTLASALAVASGGTGTSTWLTGSIPFFDGTKLTENNSALFWDAAHGRLGIGTNNPSDKVQVGDGTSDTRLSVVSNSVNQFTAKNSAGNSVKYGATTDTIPNAVISNNDGNPILTITSGGNVGIGTTTPSGKLSVISPDPSTDYLTLDLRSASGYGIYAQENSITNRGNTLEFMATDYNSGSVATRKLLTLTPTGNVGIGTTTPFYKLSVEGISSLGNSAIAGYFTATTTFASVLPYASSTALTATNLFSTNFLTLGSTTLQNFTALNATTSNATSTNFFATTASSTNLFSSLASIGTLTLVNALTVANGGTGATSLTGLVKGNGTSAFTAAAAGTDFVAPATTLTAGAGLTGGGDLSTNRTFAIDFTRANSWTGLQTFANASSTFFSNIGTAYFGATATTTIDSAGNVAVAGTLNVTGNTTLANATSTNFFSKGLLANVASIGQTGTTTITSAGFLGVGTSTPWGLLSINPNGITGPSFVIGSSTATKFIVDNGGNVGIGTTTPGSVFSINNVANFSSATSSFYGTGINLASGCFAVNGTCIGSSGGSGGSGGGQLIALFATSSLSTNASITFTGSANSAPVITYSAGIPTNVNLPSNTSYFEVEIWGGGGAYNTGTGGNTCFGTNTTACSSATMTANGGGAAVTGGTATGGDINLTGGAGTYGDSTATGGTGGSSPLGGGGGAADASGSAFGGGGGGKGTGLGGPGGGAGGYSRKLITSATGTYYYTVGAGGVGAFVNGGKGGIMISVYTTGISNGSLGSGTAGQFAFYNTAGTNLSATSSIFANTTNSFIGIGTTTPQFQLTTFSSTASQLALSAGAGISQWAFRNAGGNFYLASTTADGTATSTTELFGITNASTTIAKALYSSSAATSSFANGVNLTSGCFAVNGACISGSGGVSLSAANTWTALQLFSAGASTTLLSVFNTAYFGGTSTTTIDSAGNVTLPSVAKLSIGTTTPFAQLQIASSSASATFKAQLVLTDINGGTDAKHASFTFVNGELRVGTTSDAYATSTLLSITNASTTIAKALYSSSAATSSFANGVNLTSGCFSVGGSCIGSGSSGSGGGQLIAQYATSSVGTTTINFNGAANSAASFSAGALTLPSNTSYVVVEMWGAGGGGAGGTAATAGKQSCISAGAVACVSAIITANGGGGGTVNSTNSTGGTATGGDINVSGGQGSFGSSSGAPSVGGSAPFAGFTAGYGTTGAGFGAGGGVGADTGAGSAASGGAAGGYARKLISPVGTSYTFTLGPGGAGTTGDIKAGGNGAPGGFLISVYTTGISNGSLGSGTAGQFAFYNTAGTNLTATSSIFSNTSSYIGIGTTTPQFQLTTFSTNAAQLALSAGAGISQWAFRNAGGNFYLASTTADGTATSTTELLGITNASTTIAKALYSSSAATSSFANGVNLTSGCFSINGTCIGGGAGGVSLSAANTWTALQLFSAGASTTMLSVFNKAYFGGTSTTTIDSTGTITVTSNSANTFPYASSTALTATNLFSTNFLTLGSTTLQNFTALNATTTNATSTTFFTNSMLANFASFGQTGTTTITSAGFLGVGTSTPWGLLSINPNGITGPSFVIGSSTATSFIVDNGGKVGIGTTSPFSLFAIGANSGTNYPGNNLFLIASTTATGPQAGTFNHFAIDNTGRATIGNVAAVSTSTQLSVLAGTTTVTQASTISTGLSNPVSVYVQGRYAYVANYGNSTLGIFDASNPTSPTQVASVSSGGSNAVSVSVQGRYAYVLNDGSGTLVIFDVSNPAAPIQMSKIATGSQGNYVYVQGRYAYVVNFAGTSGLVIIDISNPTAPVRVSNINAGLTGPYGVNVQGRYAYVVSSGNNSLVTFDVSNPAAPLQVSTISTGLNSPRSVYVQGRYAYVASRTNNALVIFDISNSTSPVQVGTISTGLSTPNSVYVQGRYAYLAGSNSLVTFDVSNPASPTAVSAISSGGTSYSPYVQGRYAYVASGGNNSLVIFDLGGAYIQQLEVGGLEAGTLSLRNNLSGVDGLFSGGLSVAQSLNVTGSGSFSMYNFATTTGLIIASSTALSATGIDQNSAAISDVFSLSHFSTSTSAAGIGTGLLFNDTSLCSLANCAGATTTATSTARIASILTNVSTTSPASALAFFTKNSSTGLNEVGRFTSAGFLGVGTTTPQFQLTTFSTNAAQLALSAGAGISQWAFRNAGGNFYLASTTADGTATSTTELLGITNASTTIAKALYSSSAATSSFANGVNLTSGCFSINGTCIGGGAGGVSLSAANTWTALQLFSAGASTTLLSVFNTAYFGGTSTTTIDSAGNVTLPSVAKLGVGTTTPFALLQIASSSASATFKAQLVLTDVNGGTDAKHASFTFVNGELRVGTTSDAYATSTLLSINNSSTTIAKALYSSSAATSSFANGVNLTAGCFSIGGSCIGSGGSGGSGGGQLISQYATTTAGTTTINFNGAANSSASFSGAALTLPSNTSYIVVEMYGAGGGGGGGSAAGSNGGPSCISAGAVACVTALASAGGGVGGGIGGLAGAATPGAGGTATGDIIFNGYAAGSGYGIVGGNSALNTGYGATSTRKDGGSPGGGGSYGQWIYSGDFSAYPGGSGGGGAYSKKLISPVTTSYTFTVGAGGTGGSSSTGYNYGTNSYDGSKGGAGLVMIYVYTTGVSQGSIGAGTAGQFAFYSAATTSVSATSSIFAATNSYIGVGTTTPQFQLTTFSTNAAQLALSAGAGISQWAFRNAGGNFYLASTTADGTATSTTELFGITNASTTIAKALYSSSAATSSFANGVNLTSGCFSINGTCIGGGAGGVSLSAANTWTALQLFSAGASTTMLSVFNKAYFGGTATTTIDSAGNIFAAGTVGVGSTTPWGLLSINPSGITGPSFVIGSSTATSFVVTNGGNVGIGTTSPWATFAINPLAGFASNQFVVGSSSATSFLINNSGQVGIGTTTPFRKFSLTDTVSTAQAAISYDTTRYAELRVDSNGDFNIGASGNDDFFNNDNLWVCTGGSFTVNGCPSGQPTGQGNLFVENKIAIGTTTPNWPLQVAGTQPSIALSDSNAGANLKHWLLTSMNGFLYVGTSSDAYATTSIAAITVTNNGKVGIGSSTPTTLLSIGGLLSVGASSTGQLATMGTATSTFNGDVKITGKLDVSTIDPVYSIDGTKYATYGASTIGVREEALKTIELTQRDPSTGKYSYTIQFDTLDQGSDLWLFYQITDFGDAWKNLVVSLTPSFDGTVFYKKVPGENKLVITGDEAGEVSMRLSATRFDWSAWPILRPDQEDKSYPGFILSHKAVSQAASAAAAR